MALGEVQVLAAVLVGGERLGVRGDRGAVRLVARVVEDDPDAEGQVVRVEGRQGAVPRLRPVELAAEVRVETRLTETEGLKTGMDMELVLVPFRTDDAGNEVVTFAFRPVGGASSGV